MSNGFTALIQGSQSFSVRSHRVNISEFAGCKVSGTVLNSATVAQGSYRLHVNWARLCFSETVFTKRGSGLHLTHGPWFLDFKSKSVNYLQGTWESKLKLRKFLRNMNRVLYLRYVYIPTQRHTHYILWECVISLLELPFDQYHLHWTFAKTGRINAFLRQH